MNKTSNSFKIVISDEFIAKQFAKFILFNEFNCYYYKKHKSEIEENVEYKFLFDFPRGKKLSRRFNKTKYASLNDYELFKLIENMKNNVKSEDILDLLNEIYLRERKKEGYFLTDEIALSKDLEFSTIGLYSHHTVSGKLSTIKVRPKRKIFDKGFYSKPAYYTKIFYHELQHERQCANILRLFKGANITKNDKIGVLLYLRSSYDFNVVNEFISSQVEQLNLIYSPKLNPLLFDIEYFNRYTEFDAEFASIIKMEEMMHKFSFHKTKFAKDLIECSKQLIKNFEINNLIKGVYKSFSEMKLLFSLASECDPRSISEKNDIKYYKMFDDITRNDVQNFIKHIKSQYARINQTIRYAETFLKDDNIVNDFNQISEQK